jgi:hypothetical protein
MVDVVMLASLFINFIGYLQTYNGSITAISTVVLVIVTAIYVKLTNQILKESEKTRKSMFQPNIKPTIKPISPIHAYFEVRNVGTGAAANVMVKYWSDFNKDEPAIWRTPLMSPNETQELTLLKNDKWIIEFEDLTELKNIHFEITYEDPWEEKQFKEYNLELKDYIDFSNKSAFIHFEENSEKEIVKHLKEISDNLSDVKSISVISKEITILTDLIKTEKVISFLKDNLKQGDQIKASELGKKLGLRTRDTKLIFHQISLIADYTIEKTSEFDFLIKKIK